MAVVQAFCVAGASVFDERNLAFVSTLFPLQGGNLGIELTPSPREGRHLCHDISKHLPFWQVLDAVRDLVEPYVEVLDRGEDLEPAG